MKITLFSKTNIKIYILFAIPFLIWIYISYSLFQQCYQLAVIENEWFQINAIVYDAQDPEIGQLQKIGNQNDRSSSVKVKQNISITYFVSDTHFLGMKNCTYEFIKKELPKDIDEDEILNRISSDIYSINDVVPIYVDPQNNDIFYLQTELEQQGKYTKLTSYITFIILLVLGFLFETMLFEIILITGSKKLK